jgi:hypothetical protein
LCARRLPQEEDEEEEEGETFEVGGGDGGTAKEVVPLSRHELLARYLALFRAPLGELTPG